MSELSASEYAELIRLREEAKGPDGFKTWKDAAIHERMLRIKAENELKSFKMPYRGENIVKPITLPYKGEKVEIVNLPCSNNKQEIALL